MVHTQISASQFNVKNDRSHDASLTRIALVAVLVVLAAALVVLLIAHARIALSTRYIADDFCDAATLKSAGFFPPQFDVYRNWTGRFAAYFFMYSVHLTGPWGVGRLIAVIVLFWGLVAAWAGAQAARVISLPHPRLVGPIFGLLIVLFSIQAAPNVDESLYWLSGFFTYTLPLVFATTYIAILLHATGRATTVKRTRRLTAASLLLTFIAAGCSEPFAATQAAVLAVLVAVAWRSRASADRIPLRLLQAGLAGAVLGFIVLALAPGNVVRQQLFIKLGLPAASIPAFVGVVPGTLIAFFRTVLESLRPTVAALIVIPAAIAILLHPVGTRQALPLDYRRLALALVLLPILGVFVTVCALAPGGYTTGMLTVGRALITPVFALAIIAVATSYIAGLAIRPRDWLPNRATGRAISWACVAVLACSVVVPLHLARRVYQEGAFLLRRQASWDARHELILSAVRAGKLDVVADPVPNRTGLDEIGPDPTASLNPCVARYYGLRTIKTPARPLALK